VGPTLGEPLVVGIRSDRVRVPLDVRTQLGVILHRAYDFRIDHLLSVGLERRLVEVEVGVGRERDLLLERRRRRWRWRWWRRGRRLLYRIAEQVAEKRPEQR